MQWKDLYLLDPAEGETDAGGGAATATDDGSGTPAPAPKDLFGQQGQDDDPAGGEPAPAVIPEWQRSPLPQGHPGLQKGWKTWGDADQGYRSSSQEAQRLHGLTEQYRQAVATLGNQLQRQRDDQRAPATPPPKPGAFFGYPTKTAFDAAYQADPEGAVNRMLEHRLNPMLEEHLKPIKEQQREQAEYAHQAMLRAQASDFQARVPEAATGQPLNQATATWLGQNPWAMDVLSMPNLPQSVNRPEMIFKLATYDTLRGQLAAATKRNGDIRKTAGTARPGSGVKGSPRDKTWEDQVRRMATEGNWDEEVTQEMLTAAVNMPPIT